jgi:hypothetical protein
MSQGTASAPSSGRSNGWFAALAILSAAGVFAAYSNHFLLFFKRWLMKHKEPN